MKWRVREKTLDLSRHGMIMGILNVTPDSFSDGGTFLNEQAALKHAEQMEHEGADIIDIGGESTRPGAAAVSEEEELRRTIPIIRGIRKRSEILISIDTSKAAVAEEAVKAGADIINDVTALRGDDRMPEVATRSGAGVALMHMQGTPRTMQHDPQYDDVVSEVAEFLRQRVACVLGFGMAAENIAIDPGIGFGKKPGHNLALLRSLGVFAVIGHPVLVGVSRKSFLSWMADAPEIENRFWPGVALTSYGREQGAHIFRVHDPKPHREALRMTEAILHA